MIYPLVSSNMAGWRIPERFMEVSIGRNSSLISMVHFPARHGADDTGGQTSTCQCLLHFAMDIHDVVLGLIIQVNHLFMGHLPWLYSRSICDVCGTHMIILQNNDMDRANGVFMYCGKPHNKPSRPDVLINDLTSRRHWNDASFAGQPFVTRQLDGSQLEGLRRSLWWPSGHVGYETGHGL